LLPGVGDVCYYGGEIIAIRILLKTPEIRKHLGDMGVDGIIILKLIFKNQAVRV
jgi:hypothetical protein